MPQGFKIDAKVARSTEPRNPSNYQVSGHHSMGHAIVAVAHLMYRPEILLGLEGVGGTNFPIRGVL